MGHFSRFGAHLASAHLCTSVDLTPKYLTLVARPPGQGGRGRVTLLAALASRGGRLTRPCVSLSVCLSVSPRDALPLGPVVTTTGVQGSSLLYYNEFISSTTSARSSRGSRAASQVPLLTAPQPQRQLMVTERRPADQVCPFFCAALTTYLRKRRASRFDAREM